MDEEDILLDLPGESTDESTTGDVSVVDDILLGVSDMLTDYLATPETPEDDIQAPQVVIVQAPESPVPVEGETTETETEDIWVYDDDYGIQAYALNPITGASGLKGVLLDVLGDYDAIVVEYRYQNNNSSTYSYVREIQPDFPWLCSAAIFLALLWSIFAIGGRMICRK